MDVTVGKPSETQLREKSVYCCQFCGTDSLIKDWKNDRCPKCGRQYDAMLAQEMDDG